MIRASLLLVVLVFASSIALSGEPEAESTQPSPVKRLPGVWKTEMKIVDFDLPGMPQKMRDEAIAQALPARTECLSKEAAAKEDPVAQMTKGARTCTFTKMNLSSTIDVAGTCKSTDGKDMAMLMTGTFLPKKIEIDVDTSGPSPFGTYKSKMKITGTHTGPC